MQINILQEEKSCSCVILAGSCLVLMLRYFGGVSFNPGILVHQEHGDEVRGRRIYCGAGSLKDSSGLRGYYGRLGAIQILTWAQP